MAKTLEIEIQNLKELRQAFRRAPKITAPILAKAINATLAIIQKFATRPIVPWRTGRLTQSFGEGIRLANPNNLRGSIGPTVNYAYWVHEGTAPHDIFPVMRRALYWKGARHPVKRVKHPGTKSQPFMEEIVEKAQPAIDKIFLQAGDMITREIAKQARSI